ncbi:spoOM family protein [[Clostridium] bifermentans ATCC 638]|uniref:SpoOM family protein n=1 Tax=Paraclostridium bifermentans ATCC 638 = DSM 14991 TaxID=1233171 RepID=T4VP81_PARBF|nr:sporulation protein [Paraclostridium bifermentans]EQK42940.1 spoOM family protein [[Clostridium] bifermentans ATCC 638] [Paraclostridium bifermentans ATCC 638 = DSM 14991]RIZ58064.1 hypothetical protein CHH45_13530 [Paraclostridium bifermentans]UAG16822.1 sporulation protein [Paraclostridium bifermentans]
MSSSNEIKLKTFINSREIYPDKDIEGVCVLSGLDLNKKLHNIKIYIKTNYIKDKYKNIGGKKVVLQKVEIDLDKSIIEGGLVKVPFKFKVNRKVPVSIHKSHIWIKTCLKENGKNKLEEKYYIDILPPKYIENTIDIIENLGFSLIEVENKYTENKYDNLPFIQCFKFRRLKENLNQNEDDIEIFFKQKNECIEVYLNQNIKVTFEYKYINDLNYLTNKIYSVIKFKI